MHIDKIVQWINQLINKIDDQWTANIVNIIVMHEYI